MNERPAIIGVTRCSKLDDYLASLEKAGARARVLDVTESPRKVLNEVDGLLLTGGGDVDPVFYGADRHPLTDDAEPGRDEFEIDLARRAMSADVPLLAICRGAQVLNVAAGGTLVQDIPSAIESELSHAVTEPRDLECHDIDIVAD
jgi:putative glutamine amidotransferase